MKKSTTKKKFSQKKLLSKDSDVVHTKLGSLSKLIKTFKNRGIAARFGSSIAGQCQPDAETREFLVRLLDAAAEDDVGKSIFASQELNLGILRFLLKGDFTAEEVPYLLQFFFNYTSARHISDAYDAEIDEIFSLPDARLVTFFETLLTHEMRKLRECAIELLEVSWNRTRLRSWIAERVARYLNEHRERSSLEDALLEQLLPMIKAGAKATKKARKR